MQNNIATLTQHSKAIAAKRKVKREQIKEVLFDDEARREYLTGFHKRKKAKADAARERAKLREKEERQEDRRFRRQELRTRAAENAAEVEAAYEALLGGGGGDGGGDDDDDDEWKGVGTSSAKPEQEFEDEQTVATVTVIEDFDPTTITTGPTPQHHPPTDREPSEPVPTRAASNTKPAHKSIKSRPKVKKIRYETKQARQHEKGKQYKRKLEKAALAGGKAARKPKPKSRR